MNEEKIKSSKTEKIMIIVLIFLLILFCFVILLVVTNKDKEDVIEEPITELDVNNYVKLEDIDVSNYTSLYPNPKLKKVKFSNITDISLDDFYGKQDEIISNIEANIESNKQFIEEYNSQNNITNYSANSKIESMILYEINDNILSVLYLVEDKIDYKEISNSIINIFIDLNNNWILDNNGLLEKYNLTKEEIVSKVFDSIVQNHDETFLDKETGEQLNKEQVLEQRNKYTEILTNNFDNYLYLYFYQGNLYVKYNKPNITELLFEDNQENARFSTLKLEINQE